MSGFPRHQYFFIKSRGNDVVLDVYNGELKKDTNIIIYKKKTNNDIDNQLWYAEGGFIVNKKSGLVLDVAGGRLKPDNYIIQNERQHGSKTQQFGYREGFVYLLADPSLVVDIRGGGTKEGTKLIIYKAKTKDNANQLWLLEPVAGTIPPSSQNASYGLHNAPLGHNCNAHPQAGNSLSPSTGGHSYGGNNQYNSNAARPNNTMGTTITTTTTTSFSSENSIPLSSSQYSRPSHANTTAQYGNSQPSSQFNVSRPFTTTASPQTASYATKHFTTPSSSSQYNNNSSHLNSNITSSHQKFGTSLNSGYGGAYQQTQAPGSNYRC